MCRALKGNPNKSTLSWVTKSETERPPSAIGRIQDSSCLLEYEVEKNSDFFHLSASFSFCFFNKQNKLFNSLLT